MAVKLSIREMQLALRADGFDTGPADGVFGTRTLSAFHQSMVSDCRRLTAGDLIQAASLIDVSPAHIGAIVDVESAGRGFSATTHKAIIRQEPHWFQRLSGGRFDCSCPWQSHSYGERLKYPQSDDQAKRWVSLEAAVSLDPGAGLASASYGLGQVMGFNFSLAGYPDVWSFVRAMAKSEGEQLLAMIRLIGAKGLAGHLQRNDWAAFAEGYNGTSYRDNNYHIRLPAAFKARGGK